MSRAKIIATTILLLGLLGLCLYINRGCFQKEPLLVYHRNNTRPGAGVTRGRPSAAIPPVFGFNQAVRLTTVRVFQVDEMKTNQSPKPVWELISSSNSVPVKLIEYGVPIRGMRPKQPESRPEPLVPGAGYVLLLETPTQKAIHEFIPAARQ